jgi:Zn-dependent M28 family amino/carboxypeptidase
VPLILLIFFASISFAADEPRILGPDAIQSRFSRLHSKNDERALELRRLFMEAGCESKNYSEDRILSSKLPNLICVLAGSSKQTVVVSAHFDNRGPGEGAIDNWSGASLLPSLFESLSGSPHRLTFEFIAFTDEEKGLIGSRDFAGHLSKEDRAEILLNVNIDCVGLAGPIRAWSGRSDDFLLTAAAVVADQIKVGIGADALGKRYDSDAAVFIAWKIPAIDVHSLTRDTLPLLHSKRDVRAALDAKSYYDHYRFLAAYLAYLDATIDIPAPRSSAR